MSQKATLLLLMTAFLLAPAARADHLAETTKIIEFYQTEKYLEKALPCMERHLATMSKDLKINAAQKKKIEGLVRRIYPADNLYKIFKEQFAAAYGEEYVGKKKEFLNNPDGIKLRQAYKSTFNADKSTRQNYYDQNMKKVLTVNRKNAMLTFITSSEQDRGIAIMEARCYLAVRLAHNTYLSPKSRSSVRQLKEIAEKREPSYIPEARKQYEVFDFFLLRDYTQREIDRLTLYYQSIDGTPFLKAYKKALTSTMEAAANTLYSQMSAPKTTTKK